MNNGLKGVASFAADERMLTMLADAIFSDVVGHDLLGKRPATH